jgi:hypothetical protein
LGGGGGGDEPQTPWLLCRRHLISGLAGGEWRKMGKKIKIRHNDNEMNPTRPSASSTHRNTSARTSSPWKTKLADGQLLLQHLLSLWNPSPAMLIDGRATITQPRRSGRASDGRSQRSVSVRVYSLSFFL